MVSIRRPALSTGIVASGLGFGRRAWPESRRLSEDVHLLLSSSTAALPLHRRRLRQQHPVPASASSLQLHQRCACICVGCARLLAGRSHRQTNGAGKVEAKLGIYWPLTIDGPRRRRPQDEGESRLCRIGRISMQILEHGHAVI